MEGASRMIAFGATAVALVTVAAYVALGGGDSQPTPSAAAGDAEEPAAEPAARADLEPTPPVDDKLILPNHDHPVVWVRKGQEVEIHSAPGGPVVETVGAETEFGSRRVFSVFRAEGDEWAGVPTPLTGNDALGWVRLDARDLKVGYTSQEIVVDLSDRRAELVRDGEVVRAFTVSVGAPGTETPTGRFAVTDTFRGGLNAAYGCCAVALTAEQPNLPSGWLGGNRIALHGTSGPLGGAISAGCVRAADRDVSALVDTVPPGAPVTVRE